MTNIGRVLITGAAGHIGRTLRAGLAGKYEVLRLTDVLELGEPGAGEEIVLADLTEMDSLTEAMRGMDAVVHLGGIPNESTYLDIRRVNMDGTYHVFEAARMAGVRRVVFASSIHAVGYYPRSEKIGPDVPVRPDTYYGVSKVFGEALARMYFDRYGIEAACLRICSFVERPLDRRHLSTWLSPRDCTELVRCCLDVSQLGFRILAGISGNTRAWMTGEGWAEVGYAPQDNGEIYAAQVEGIHGPPEALSEQRQGGVFVDPGYRGLAERGEKG